MKQQFEVMRDALNKTGRPIVYAIDDWGVTNPWDYGISVRLWQRPLSVTCRGSLNKRDMKWSTASCQEQDVMHQRTAAWAAPVSSVLCNSSLRLRNFP